MIVSAFAVLLGMGGAPRASHLHGARRHGQAPRRSLGNCFTLH